MQSTHVALLGGCSIPTAEWLDLPAVGIVQHNIFMWHSNFLEVGTKTEIFAQQRFAGR